MLANRQLALLVLGFVVCKLQQSGGESFRLFDHVGYAGISILPSASIAIIPLSPELSRVRSDWRFYDPVDWIALHQLWATMPAGDILQ